MTEGDVEAAHFIAVETVTTTTEDGKTKKKKVKMHIYEPEPEGSNIIEPAQMPDSFAMVDDHTTGGGDEVPIVVQPKPTKVIIATFKYHCGILTQAVQRQRDYIVQFVQRVDEILEALLDREALKSDDFQCRNCN